MTGRGPVPHLRVVGLPRYQPGRSQQEAMAAHGLESAVKLASNETPFGPLPGVADAVAAALDECNRYADHTADAVAQQFALRFDVPRDHVAVGPGAVGLLEQIALAFTGPGDDVVYPWPSFIAYPQFTRLTGATPRTVPLVRQRCDADAVIAALTERTNLLLLANPNNPTSTALRADELDRIVAAVPVVIVFAFIQKWLITGFSAGAVKG